MGHKVFFIVGFLIYCLLVAVQTATADVCEQFDFGDDDPSDGFTYFHVYSDPYDTSLTKWDFIAEFTMHVDNLEIESVLDAADPGGTFHIEVRFNDSLVTAWKQYVGSDYFRSFKHSAAVDVNVEVGDKITYYIYGGTATDSVGGIGGPNFLRLCRIETQEELAEAFVTRFYQLLLDRQPDSGGLASWVNPLLSGLNSGVDVARGFLLSPEFTGKGFSNEEYLTVLYEAVLNRDPDMAGWDLWLAELNKGTDRAYVLNGFIHTKEFAKLCDKYGIKAYEGHFPKSQREPVEDFVTRFYQLCLDRDPDPAGLGGWTNDLLNQVKTGADAARGFIFSPEFIEKNTSNGEYLTILYEAFFNREPDLTGWDLWLVELNIGKDRGEVLNGFIYAREFAELCRNFGIKPY